jgi:glycosyltransferase involved in cell wall biosynthesis
MKKILFVWDRLDSLGGVEVVIYNLSKKLSEKGYSVYLAVFKNGYVRQMFEEIGVNIKVFQRKNKFDLNLFKEFYNFVKNEKIDVIHTHGHFPGIIGRFAGKLLKKKVISTYHLALNEDGHPTITKILTKITLPLADYITFVSQKVEKSFFNDSMVFDYSLINKRNHFTIYNGVDIEEINKSLEGLDRNLNGYDRPEKWVRPEREIKDFTELKMAITNAINGDGFFYPVDKLVYNKDKSIEFIKKILSVFLK